MSDIIKAIEKEKEYLAYRMKGEEPFHLVDAIKDCGFKSLEEYFEVKRRYQFNNLKFEFIESTPSECISVGMSVMDSKTTCVVMVDSFESFAFAGNSKPYNKEYCKTNNISVYPLYTNGGTMVGKSGDFSFGICVPESIKIDSKYMLKNIKRILRKYIDNVSIDGNDIMVDGCKVIGATEYTHNGMYLFIAHLSFSDHSEMIENICYIESKSEKTPSYIKGMTVDEFKREVMEWLTLSI